MQLYKCMPNVCFGWLQGDEADVVPRAKKAGLLSRDGYHCKVGCNRVAQQSKTDPEFYKTRSDYSDERKCRLSPLSFALQPFRDVAVGFADELIARFGQAFGVGTHLSKGVR
jgi:hypothetical protein